jgi:hypothetical protein
MHTRRVIILVLLFALLAAPVAMAADGCPGMISVCAAPCSAPCVASPLVASDPLLIPISTLTVVSFVRVPTRALRALDAPPKSLSA